MIRLSGLVSGKDINIIFSGLRLGEKLYEELLNKEEHTIPTHHYKIKISKVIAYPYGFVAQAVEDLINLDSNKYSIVKKMKKIIPEFKSNNSVFERLDELSVYS